MKLTYVFTTLFAAMTMASPTNVSPTLTPTHLHLHTPLAHISTLLSHPLAMSNHTNPLPQHRTSPAKSPPSTPPATSPPRPASSVPVPTSGGRASASPTAAAPDTAATRLPRLYVHFRPFITLPIFSHFSLLLTISTPSFHSSPPVPIDPKLTPPSAGRPSRRPRRTRRTRRQAPGRRPGRPGRRCHLRRVTLPGFLGPVHLYPEWLLCWKLS